ncbi:unnamed protein product [Victoria cruziana]
MEMGLPLLLKASWLAGILPIALASLPFSGLRQLREVVMSFAKRGKLNTSSHSQRFTVPQSFFLHFYLVAVVWTMFLAIATWSYAYSITVPVASQSLHYSTIASHLTGGSHMFSIHKPQSTPSEYIHLLWKTVFLLLMMEIQALRRLYETIYVFNYSEAARMHIFGYLTGLFFYTAAPLSFCSLCWPDVYGYVARIATSIIIKGKTPADMKYDWWRLVKPFTVLGWWQWIGAIMFAWGSMHQFRCHNILGSLRMHNKEEDYKIPKGDWFDLVSCPHYLAEVVIYAGILIANEGSDFTVWLLFVFVVANLVFVAGETHRWYLRKFDHYPQSRRAIFPCVY